MKNSEKDKNKVELLAVTVEKGIITLIEEDGSISFYRQHNISNLDNNLRTLLINKGLLDSQWQAFEEIPDNYKIHFEAPEIQGKAHTSFPDPYKLIMHKMHN